MLLVVMAPVGGERYFIRCAGMEEDDDASTLKEEGLERRGFGPGGGRLLEWLWVDGDAVARTE